ncbi:MAG: RsmB/NOP family class I SAM-dependent RNA methyltransferase [Candidatus Aenigmatarchaeota archaeon]
MEFLPKEFQKERYRKIYGEDFFEFLKILPQSIRVNTIKISVKDFKRKVEEKGWKLKGFDWYDEGFYVEANENISKTIEHQIGYFFIQNASSMVPPLVLDPKKDEIILDLCAAPGAKTTQLAQIMENTGVIIANDVKVKRIRALKGNLQRMGVVNTVITIMDGGKFWKTGLKFEKILLDVPCSGSGSLNPRVFQQIGKYTLNYLKKIQKRLLISASKCLKKDGILVYSTCSLEPEENEEIIDFAIKKLGLETEEIKIKGLEYIEGLRSWNGNVFSEGVKRAIRIIPKEKEGFFICKLRK